MIRNARYWASQWRGMTGKGRRRESTTCTTTPCSRFGLTLRLKLRGRGLRAEADAARRLPHVTWRAAGGVPP
jgi:hypothetical protein